MLPPYGVHPWEPLSGGATDSYDQSLARITSCKPVQEVAITKRLQDTVQVDRSGGRRSVAFRLPSFGCPLPLIGPTTKRKPGPGQVGLVAAFRFSAKFICMRFCPNRLTAIQTGNRLGQFFGTWPFSGFLATLELPCSAAHSLGLPWTYPRALYRKPTRAPEPSRIRMPCHPPQGPRAGAYPVPTLERLPYTYPRAGWWPSRGRPKGPPGGRKGGGRRRGTGHPPEQVDACRHE